jgi:type II secretory pathway component PulK
MRSSCRIFERAAGAKRKSRGFILVTVLMVSALFLGLAASYATFARREMRRVSDEEFASSSRALAVMTCREVGGWIAADAGASDSRHEPLYSGEPVKLDYDDYSVYATVSPLDDRIPINGLLLPDGATVKNEYAYPWSVVWSNLEYETPPPVLDFIDTDGSARQGSREDDYFPNGKLSDLSELLRLPEIGRAKLYSSVGGAAAVDSYFTVYGDEGININMAPAYVIAALDPGIGSDVAAAVAAFRLERPINGEADLKSIAGFSISVATRLKNVIHYKSNFFLVALRVERGTAIRNFEAVVRRGGGGFNIVNWRE